MKFHFTPFNKYFSVPTVSVPGIVCLCEGKGLGVKQLHSDTLGNREK